MDVLSSYTIKDLYPPRTIHFIDENDKVTDVIRMLSNHNIYSAPILSKRNKIIGLLSFSDLVEFAIKSHDDLESWGHEHFESFLEHNERMAVTKIKQLNHIVDVDDPIYIGTQCNMRDVIKKLSEEDIKRILVIDENKNVINIITQSSVIEFIWSHKSKFSDIWDKPISEFNIRTREKQVVSINEKENLINAFKLLRKAHVSAICVVNDDNQLVGTISVKDLRTVTPGLTIMQRLYIPVKHFLKKIRIETKAPKRSITCSENEEFGNIIEKLHESSVHRVWIVDRHMKPIGAISLQDILKIIYNASK